MRTRGSVDGRRVGHPSSIRHTFRSARWGESMRRLTVSIIIAWSIIAGVARTEAQCTAEVCIDPANLLTNISGSQGALLDALDSSLTGASVDLPLAGQQALASSSLKLDDITSALMNAGLATSANNALTANLTLSQLTTALSAAAGTENNTSAQMALTSLSGQLAGVAGTTSLSKFLSADTRSVPLGQS